MVIQITEDTQGGGRAEISPSPGLRELMGLVNDRLLMVANCL